MNNLGKLEIVLPNDEKDEVVTLDLDGIVPISENISQEFTDQPSLYAYVAVLAARTEAAWADAEIYRDEIYAQTDKEVRKDLAYNLDKAPTETMVKQEVRLRRGYNEAVQYELQMREQHLVMKALTKAMDMRANMLVSLGAQLRSEREQTDMHINDLKDNLRRYKSKTKGKRPVKPVNENDDDYDTSEFEREFV